MKILKGRLMETRFSQPTVGLNEAGICPLQQISVTDYNENQVTYMADTLGLHKISNPDAAAYAVSLHCTLNSGTPLLTIWSGHVWILTYGVAVYTPPNAAVYGCNMFDEQTGKPTHVRQADFFSEYGRPKTTTKAKCESPP